MPVKQTKNWTVFGEVQTSNMTSIACLTRFRLISHPFKNPHRIPTGPRGFITVPIPIPMGIPHGNPHTYGSPDIWRLWSIGGCRCRTTINIRAEAWRRRWRDPMYCDSVQSASHLHRRQRYRPPPRPVRPPIRELKAKFHYASYQLRTS